MNPPTFLTTVCPGSEYNALRERLPRATRRAIPRAGPGDRGIIVQAIGPDDSPLATRYACVREHDDPHPTLQRLQRQIDRQLSSIVEPCPPASPPHP